MGNDTTTFGASLRLRPGVNESCLVAAAAQFLAQHEDEQHRTARIELVRAASTLEELFAAFKHIIVRDTAGQVVSCTASSPRYDYPEVLWEAIAPGVADGSWVAFDTEVGPHLVTFTDGTATTQIGVGPVAEQPLDSWSVDADAFGVRTDTDMSVTYFVRVMSARPHLADGYARPNLSADTLAELAATGTAWTPPAR